MCIKIYMTDKRRQRNDDDNVQWSSNIIIYRKRTKKKKERKLNKRKPQWTLMLKDAYKKNSFENQWEEKTGVLLMISLYFTYLIKLLSL